MRFIQLGTWQTTIAISLAMFACLWTVPSTIAAIVSTDGEVVVAIPPADISNSAWESSTEIRAFPELQQTTLAVPVAIDISVPGTSPNATDTNLSPSTIPSGTVVSSYLLHFDVIGRPGVQNAIEGSGSITMSDPIIGLIVLSTALDNTNTVLGLSNVVYADGSDRGLAFDPAGVGTSDIVTLSADRKTVTVDLRDASFPDELRIVTAVPEPQSIELAVTATGTLLAGISISRRKKR